MKEFSFLSYKIPPKEKEMKVQKRRKICKNREYHQIYQLITECPISLNEICQSSNKSVADINNILLMLELDGYIKKVAGGYVCILDKK